MHSSQVGFCCTEIPVMMLLEESNGYKMDPPDEREIKCKQNLIINDLKSHQQNQQKLKMANEILLQASMGAGVIYGVKKCAEMVFKNGRIIKGERLQILQERMKTLDPNENKIYKSRKN